MANVVTIPRTVLDQALRQPVRPVRCPVGWSRWNGHQELLVRGPGPIEDHYFELRSDDDFSPATTWHDGCAGLLTIGREWHRGQAFGLIELASGIEPVDMVKLVGPGMYVFSLRTPDPSRPGTPEAALDPLVELWELWSRTIGAVGEQTWQRLVGLTYAIVGVGRTGGLLAQLMAAGWGVERLIVIDPDRVEVHNLGEMSGLARSDIGRWKAEVVAQRLRSPIPGRPAVIAVNESITHLLALRAVQEADVVFGGVDHDGARLATAILATLFCKPYVDVATGIHGTGDRRQMGADVRLTIPGYGRCLLCLGGLADPAGARRALASAELEQAFRLTRDWRQERTGSLRSLNQLAASIAMRLWEDFVAERVRESTWVHLEFDPAGRVQVSYPLPGAAAPCRLCQLMGLGEEGLARTTEIIQPETTRGRT